MRLALLGDVMLGRGVARELGRRPPAEFWGDLLPELRAADVVIANLECAITTHTTPWRRSPKVFHFGAPPAAVDVLRAAGIRAVSLANNHVLDFEVEGLQDTLRQLDDAGIAHAGAGGNLDAALEPALVVAGDTRLGLIAFTDNQPKWAAGPRHAGTAFLDIDPTPAALSAVAAAVGRARERGAQQVLLSLHWGPNMVERPPDAFRAFARAAVARGVDVVWGHSAHIVQGIELVDGRPVLYGTGDALDDYVVDRVLRNDLSFLFLLELDGTGVREIRLLPMRLGVAVVNRARGADAELIRERMRQRCAELGTRVEDADASLRIQPPPSLAAKVALLGRAGSYTEPTRDVEIIETHMAYVFLTDAHAYKLKKPVHHPYLDFSTLAARQRDAHEEVRLNRRLAPDVYLGVTPLTRPPGGALELGGTGEVVDWLVRMRRLPRVRMLDGLIRRHELTGDDIAALAQRLARFYAGLPPIDLSDAAYRARTEAELRRSLEALRGTGPGETQGAALPGDDLERVERAGAVTLRLLRGSPELFGRRAAQGRIVEGHGDLRPEHICMLRPPVIIDCVAFNAEFRRLDPLDDLALLALECQRLGEARVGPAVLDAYARATGDAPEPRLVAFYTTTRALLRARLALWHLGDPSTARDGRDWLAIASAYIALAARHAPQ